MLCQHLGYGEFGIFSRCDRETSEQSCPRINGAGRSTSQGKGLIRGIGVPSPSIKQSGAEEA